MRKVSFMGPAKGWLKWMLLVGFATTGAHANTILSYWVDLFGGGCVGTSCTAGAAQSGTPTPTQLANPTEEAGGAHDNFNVPTFNENLGTLQSVDLILTWASSGNALLSNISCYTPTGCVDISFSSATASVPLTLTADGSTLNVQGNAMDTVPVNPNNPPNLIDCSSTNQATYNGNGCAYNSNDNGPGKNSHNAPGSFVNSYPGLTGNGQISQNNGNLAFFEGVGAGTFAASVANGGLSVGAMSTDPNAPTNLFFSGSAMTGGILQVIYTYNASPAPEPLTVFLVGFALVGVGLAGRRSRAAKR